MVKCKNCGRIISLRDTECPNCNSKSKIHYKKLSGTLHIGTKELKIQQRGSDGTKKVEAISRRKKGGKSGRPAIEEQTYNHTDPNVTVKTHKIWEKNKRGTFKKVHDHTDTFPAKHRKSNST